MNNKFIRKHADMKVVDSMQIEMYIFICKLLLKKELEKISRKDRTSS